MSQIILDLIQLRLPSTFEKSGYPQHVLGADSNAGERPPCFYYPRNRNSTRRKARLHCGAICPITRAIDGGATDAYRRMRSCFGHSTRHRTNVA